MKRPIASLTLAALAVGAFAQANFTIVRPVDNAKVREKVKIQFPKGSVPSGAYVGIFLNGQLIDAVVPQSSGKYLQYVLDTKGRGLADTPSGKPARLEAKLYVNYNDQPRIVRTSSVDLNIANSASIKVPNRGFALRYRFTPGTEMVYRMTQRVAVDTISESQNKLGGKPAELPIDTESIRIKYAVDNAYPDGTGLVRMQAVPEKGKTYAILTTSADDQPKKYDQNDMAAVYMKLTSTGKELFGSIPAYYPLEGTSAMGNKLSLFGSFPLPTLPDKSVRPGDSWPTKFQNGKIDLEKLYGQTSVVNAFGPARGEFLGVEWEMGHPCAKIKNTIAVAQMTDADKRMMKAGAKMAGEKVKVEETLWFALDTRQMLKIVRDQTIETKMEGSGGTAPGGMGGSGGYPGGRPGAGSSRPSGGGGYPGGSDRVGPDTGSGLLRQSGLAAPPSLSGQGGRPGAGGGYPGAGGRPGATGAGTEATYVRMRIQRIFVLEG